MPHDILKEIELGSRRDSGALFVELVAEYLARTRAERGAISTALSANQIAERFDEPMPRAGSPLPVVSAVLNGQRVLRVTIMNPLTHVDHVTRLLDGLVEEAQSLL